MNTLIALEVCGVLLCWVLVARAIWKWGPGLRRRSVHCPEKEVATKVLADQREADFACLRVLDVKECSLLKSVPVTCSKGCIGQL